jgi:succinate dehydrogenase / fumarate reductase flavoprotein subunit
MVDKGLGVGQTGKAVYLDFADAIEEQGREEISDKYGNLFEMYEKITGDDPYETPMKIFPAVHYVMGGLWVDYDLQSSIPGLFVAGEANFSDHGANRLGASALMQGLSDGYFIIPHSVGNYLAESRHDLHDVDGTEPSFAKAEQEVRDHINSLIEVSKKNADKPEDERRTAMDIYKELGKIMWDNVGISRSEESLQRAQEKISDLRDDFWEKLYIPTDTDTFNKNLEVAGRVADFLELGELMAKDALHRDESCGCHFREEHQTEKGEALRNDEDFSYVAAWEFKGEDEEHELHKEDLEFESVELKQRSYE